MSSNTDNDIVKLYNSGNYSTYELAEKFNTYPNKIRRILRKNGVPLRTKSAAQKNALRKGRASHPTKGKNQSEATKRKISDSQGKVWDEMSDEERQRRSDNGREAWNKKVRTRKTGSSERRRMLSASQAKLALKWKDFYSSG